MDLFLLYLSAILRPIFFIELGQANLFDVAAIVLFASMTLALLARAAVGGGLRFNAVDAMIGAFAVWCICIVLIYPDKSDLRTLAKMLMPLAAYVVTKNVLASREQYVRMLTLMVAAFALPVVVSTLLILTGHGLEEYGENYWTGIPRWEGAYAGSHNLGHNMTFLIMLMTALATLRSQTEGGRRLIWIILVLGAAALYCLWASQVRTAIAGLAVFAAVFLFFTNKKLLLYGAVGVTIVTIVSLPVLVPYLFPDVVMIKKSGGDATQLASGRPGFWAQNLALFAQLPIDRQLAGAGIGNRAGYPRDQGEGFMDSHSDFLDVAIQTGVIGFVLFVVLQFVILRKILRLDMPERHLFLAIFAAVTVMNLASNSYVARFGLAQMFYMLLAFIDLPKPMAAGHVSPDAHQNTKATQWPVHRYRPAQPTSRFRFPKPQ